MPFDGFSTSLRQHAASAQDLNRLRAEPVEAHRAATTDPLAQDT